ncbi:MAG: hypothetical protein HQK49_08410 [Oligoflexia bacterium]|nr:hypothetical protein [Oligoflexia bacterium]
MTQITINSNKLEHNFEPKSTLYEIVDFLLTNYLNENEVITKIELDNVPVPNNDIKIIHNTLIDGHNHINFSVQDRPQLIFDTLVSCENHLNNTIVTINKISELYRSDDANQSYGLFIDMIEQINTFIYSMSIINKSLEQHISSNPPINEEFHALELDLLTTLKTLLTAKKNNDNVQISDLLEKNLVSNLQKWISDMIPKLKKII